MTKRALFVAGHYFPHLIIAFFSLSAVIEVFGLSGWWTVADWTQYPLLIVAAVGWFKMHLGKLCLYCARALPADAPARAQRRMWWLHTYHHRMGRWVAVVVAGLVVHVVALVVTGRARADSLLWDLWYVVTCTVPIVVIWGANLMHGRYRAWCPWCRNRDDDGEDELVPDPDPSQKRPVPGGGGR